MSTFITLEYRLDRLDAAERQKASQWSGRPTADKAPSPSGDKASSPGGASSRTHRHGSFSSSSRRAAGAAAAAEEEELPQCTVCLCEYEDEEIIMRLPCMHEFHDDCIKMWTQTHTTCPICRVSLLLPDQGGAERRQAAGAGGAGGARRGAAGRTAGQSVLGRISALFSRPARAGIPSALTSAGSGTNGPPTAGPHPSPHQTAGQDVQHAVPAPAPAPVPQGSSRLAQAPGIGSGHPGSAGPSRMGGGSSAAVEMVPSGGGGSDAV